MAGEDLADLEAVRGVSDNYWTGMKGKGERKGRLAWGML
jgi:hypothetical protein